MRALNVLSGLFGIIFVAIGVLGFMPDYTPDGLLFGYFEVDNMHNWVHIITGIIFLLAVTNANAASTFFKLFGLIYLAVAIAGFVLNGDLKVMHANMADNILHLCLGIVALYIGLFVKKPGY